VFSYIIHLAATIFPSLMRLSGLQYDLFLHISVLTQEKVGVNPEENVRVRGGSL
jgi:hypothetical protein